MAAFDITDIEHQNEYKLARISGIVQKPMKFSFLKNILNQNLIIPLSE
jgi:hypothetical protein